MICYSQSLASPVDDTAARQRGRDTVTGTSNANQSKAGSGAVLGIVFRRKPAARRSVEDSTGTPEGSPNSAKPMTRSSSVLIWWSTWGSSYARRTGEVRESGVQGVPSALLGAFVVGARVVLATAEEKAEGMMHFAGSDLAAALDAIGSCNPIGFSGLNIRSWQSAYTQSGSGHPSGFG